VVDYSELVVGTSIASYDLMHVSHGAMAVRCRAPAPSHHTSPYRARIVQERAKCAMVDYSELVVGTSIASYDLMHVSHGAVAVRCRAPAHYSQPSHLTMTLHATCVKKRIHSAFPIAAKRRQLGRKIVLSAEREVVSTWKNLQ